jgi:predicted component of type VI protein secretion system
MKRSLLVGLLLLSLTGCSSQSGFKALEDGPCSKAQATKVSQHVSSQLQAMANEDWEDAYSFAAGSFQKVITLEDFRTIIESDYSVLVSNQGYSFGNCTISGEEIAQLVNIELPNSSASITYVLSVEEEKIGIVAARFSTPEDIQSA